ncbi:MAG: PQQ-binding-like beta-propeller repeat protein, partial [Verrucomicrobiales bacterium]|nr:PQQ-binding-like beta-propeller repeat protein [Verrucomicrobiales bacterium]
MPYPHQNQRRRILKNAFAILLLLCAAAPADDWPRFLGPAGNNVSKEKGILDAFPKGGPPQIFSRRIGTGYSAPSIRDGKLVVFHRVSKLYKVEETDTPALVIKHINGELAALKAKERLTDASLKAAIQNTRRRGFIEWPKAIAKHLDVEAIDCLDAKTGKLIWRHAYPTTYEDPYGYNNGPRCAPLLTKDRCYTFGAEGVLLCLDLKTGKQIWRRDTHKDFKVNTNFF